MRRCSSLSWRFREQLNQENMSTTLSVQRVLATPDRFTCFAFVLWLVDLWSYSLLKNCSLFNNLGEPRQKFREHLRIQRTYIYVERLKGNVKRLAYKLGNPRLNRITFHRFRHWKATTLCHKTKDILYVMNFLGHKNIKNTLIYIQLEEALFKRENEEFICKAAKTVEESKKLVETGFDYIRENEGIKLFRKRK